MLERIAAYWQSQLVFVAAKLGIADVLVEGPLTVDEIAARVGAHPPIWAESFAPSPVSASSHPTRTGDSISHAWHRPSAAITLNRCAILR